MLFDLLAAIVHKFDPPTCGRVFATMVPEAKNQAACIHTVHFSVLVFYICGTILLQALSYIVTYLSESCMFMLS